MEWKWEVFMDLIQVLCLVVLLNTRLKHYLIIHALVINNLLFHHKDAYYSDWCSTYYIYWALCFLRELFEQQRAIARD